MELMSLLGELLSGFSSLFLVPALVGVAASLAVARYYDYATSPLLELVADDGARQTGQRPDEDRHEFLQIKTRQQKAPWPFGARRPAWNCRAVLEVFRSDGSRAVSTQIIARWSGSLQPYRTQVLDQRPAQVADTSLVPLGQKRDVYAYADEQIGIAVKFQGRDECWIFSNESYFSNWTKPDWRLERGKYYLRVQVYYESSEPARAWFGLVNNGPNLTDWGIELVDHIPFSSKCESAAADRA